VELDEGGDEDGDGDALIPASEGLLDGGELRGDEVTVGREVVRLAVEYNGDQLGATFCPENVVWIGYNPEPDTESQE